MMVAQKLKAIVLDKGVSYSSISLKTGISIDSISRSFLGKRRLTADEMISICKAVGVDLRDLSSDPTQNSA